MNQLTVYRLRRCGVSLVLLFLLLFLLLLLLLLFPFLVCFPFPSVVIYIFRDFVLLIWTMEDGDWRQGEG